MIGGDRIQSLDLGIMICATSPGVSAQHHPSSAARTVIPRLNGVQLHQFHSAATRRLDKLHAHERVRWTTVRPRPHLSWPPQAQFIGIKCSASTATIAAVPSPPSRTAKELQELYGSRGLSFFEQGGVTTVELRLENGSRVRLLVPNARIFSYKPHMWHGGEEELLHFNAYSTGSGAAAGMRRGNGKLTSPSSEMPLHGGIDLRVCHSQNHPSCSLLPSSPPESWSVEDARCEPSNYAQITLISLPRPSSQPGDTNYGASALGAAAVQLRYVVTLTPNYLSSAVVVTNVGREVVEFTSSIVTHLAVSSVEGALAVGLKGYRRFSTTGEPGKDRKISGLRSWFARSWSSSSSSSGASDEKKGPGFSDVQGADDKAGSPQEVNGRRWDNSRVETEEYSRLRAGEDRLYRTPPESFALLDRGLRRSLTMQRLGFQEFCLSNPGPGSNLPDWNDFICVGPAQTSLPVTLSSNEEWRAAQILVNSGSD